MAANEAAKIVKWARIWMLDIGAPYQQPILMGEDNDACRHISEGGRLSRQVRHLCIQTAILQSDAQRGIFKLFRQDTKDNTADHQTKFLPSDTFWAHTSKIMGERFITSAHQRAIDHRNQPKESKSALP